MEKRLVFVSVVLAVTALSTTLSAEECYRPTECPGAQLCIERVCDDAGDALESCNSVDDCQGGGDEVCHDGYCKTDGVYCENPAGYCYVKWGRSGCICADGLGVSSTNDSEGADESTGPTDEELYAQCQASLSSSCGTKAPDISDECTEEQLERCNAYFEHTNDLRVACGEEPEDYGYVETKYCCRDADDPQSERSRVMDCVLDLELDQCAELEGCYELYDDDKDTLGGRPNEAGDDAERADEEEAKATDDTGSEDSGCSVTGGLGTRGSKSGVIVILDVLIDSLFD